uniref:Immunoglobulin V-set domain-containing protein n=1 Tax=Cyprinus carpio TaxID=7962 RepID=A0A8C2CX09_CYPCA
MTMVQKFVLFCLWHLFGVFGDTVTVKSVSVLEGDSVTLETGFTEMMDDHLIQWKFGNKNTLIAEINVMTDSMTVYDDVLDERFRDRLKMDHQTGSLTIMNITAQHAGLYQLQSNSVYELFSITVHAPVTAAAVVPKCKHLNITELCQTHAEVQCCDTVEAVMRLVVTALMGVAAAAAAVLLLNDVRSSRG